MDRLLEQLTRRPDLRLAYLFGSRARGTAGPRSDHDLALLCDAPLGPWERGRIAEELGRVLGGEVDVVDLRGASPLLRMAVIRDGQLLYSRSADEDRHFRLATLREYQDTERLRALQHETFLRWTKEVRGGAAS